MRFIDKRKFTQTKKFVKQSKIMDHYFMDYYVRNFIYFLFLFSARHSLQYHNIRQEYFIANPIFTKIHAVRAWN